MEGVEIRAILQRHLRMTRRIREMSARKDSAEFAEGRLLDYEERIRQLEKLCDESRDSPIETLKGMIAVSYKVLALKRSEFNFPVPHDSSDPDEATGGSPVPVPSKPFVLTGAGGRTFAESGEWNDW